MAFPLVDLHNHTTASDGRQSPAALVQMALDAGLDAIAVTDHDTVSGVQEALDAAKGTNLWVIPGVELSIDFAGELHILGLFVDLQSDRFMHTMQTLRKGRNLRLCRMLEILNGMGLSLTREDILVHAKGESVGRGHVSRALAAKGYAKSPKEAFDKYLAYGACAYVPDAKISLADAIGLLRETGAAAVWAHPMLTARDQMTLHALLGQMKEFGLSGVECFHPSADMSNARMLERMCLAQGLSVTGGTDFHDHPGGAPFGWAASQWNAGKYDPTACETIMAHQRWF